MNINHNHGIAVGPAGRIEGGAQVVNHAEDHSSHTHQSTYHGPVGTVVGEAHSSSFQTTVGGSAPVDLSPLAAELRTLREAAKKEAEEPEQDDEVSALGKAQRAAEKNDSSAVVEALKSAGKWSLSIAEKIGTSVATEMIKKSLGA